MDGFQIRCHHCGHWLGESPQPLEVVGVFKDARQRQRMDQPYSWHCRGCGWVSVFVVPKIEPSIRPWRELELKRANGA